MRFATVIWIVWLALVVMVVLATSQTPTPVIPSPAPLTTPPVVTWEVKSGLPPGMTFDASTATITGIPTTAGRFYPYVCAKVGELAPGFSHCTVVNVTVLPKVHIDNTEDRLAVVGEQTSFVFKATAMAEVRR